MFVAVPFTIELVEVELDETVWELEEDPDADEVVRGDDVDERLETVEETETLDVEDRVDTVEDELLKVVDDTTADEEVVGTAPCWYISSLRHKVRNNSKARN
jgi:hypothetical protein